MAGPIAEDDQGNRIMWNGQQWQSLPNAKAPGARYLPQSYGAPDKSEAANFNKWRSDQEPGINNARSTIAQTREMEGLLQRQKTGGIYAVPVIGDVAGMFDPEIRRMEGLSSEAARSKRQPGEGTISDFDARMFQAQVFGKAQPTEVNRAIIRANRLAADAAIQKRAFADAYYQTFGNRVGFDEAWDRYSQENPIFSPESEAAGRPILNPNRQNWREYFGMVRTAGDKTPTQAESDLRRTSGTKKKPEGWTAGLPAAQRKAALLYKGATGKAGSKANPFVPASLAEFQKIPPGSYFIDDDGTVLPKR